MERLMQTTGCSSDEYLNAFLYINQVTNVTKLRDFQYRLLHNAIFTNDRLYYWKKVDTQRCNLCLNEKQTVKHLFWDCVKTNSILEKLKEFIKCDLNVPDSEYQFNFKN